MARYPAEALGTSAAVLAAATAEAAEAAEVSEAASAFQATSARHKTIFMRIIG